MEHCSTDAILLGVMDFREADRLVTLFTLQFGKLKGVARGAKRSMRRFGGILEPFARLTVHLTFTSGLARIEGADVTTIHPHIRQDLLKVGYAGYACESADLLLPDELPNPRLFRLLAAYLAHLDVAPPAPSDRRFFEMNLLNILGYRPALGECASCGTDLRTISECRTGAAGSILCGRCGRGGRRVSGDTLTLLEKALKTGQFGHLIFSADQQAEAATILDPAIAQQARRPLKSLGFLREMEGEFCAKVS